MASATSNVRFGIITALPVEFAAVRAMLDGASALPRLSEDPNDYIVGTIPTAAGRGRHRVVVTCLVEAGNNAASIAATHMLRSVPSIQDILMVGIAGGCPMPAEPAKHVRLGDIVVSDISGVVQYDHVSRRKEMEVPRGGSAPPSSTLLSKVRSLESARLAGECPWEDLLPRTAHLEGAKRPRPQSDRLSASDDPERRMRHPRDPARRPGRPRVHYGRIGSGNTLMRDPVRRDRLRDRYDLRAIEMEGSGIADATWGADQRGYLVIRGICDYCDSHKSDKWHGYAAAAAAAYARALLASVQPAASARPAEASARRRPRELAARAVLSGSVVSSIPQRQHLIGRVSEKQWVVNALRSAVPITALVGMGGIGKSSIALEVAHSCLDGGDFEAVVWTSCRDYKVSLEDILDSTLRCASLELALNRRVGDKRYLALDILRSRRILLVVDSYEEVISDREIAAFLELVGSPSRVLITSRHRPSFDCIPVEVRELVQRDAIDLTRWYADTIGLDARAVSELVNATAFMDLTGRAPLAVKWVLGQIKHRGLSFESAVRQLAAARGDLFAGIFGRSWDILGKDARKVLMVASVFSSPVALGVYQRVTDLPAAPLEDAIAQLSELSLLNYGGEVSVAKRTYEIHPLTRAFAGFQLSRRRRYRAAVLSRRTGYYLSYALTHGGEDWDRERFDALERELPNIADSLQWCVEEHEWSALKQFRQALTLFLSIRGHWSRRRALALQTIRACDETDDSLLRAWCLVYDLAYLDLKYNDLESAGLRAREGLHVFLERGDILGMATAKRHLGRIHHIRGQYDEARALYVESHRLYVSADAEYGAFLLCDLGELSFSQGQYEESRQQFSEAVRQSKGRTGKGAVAFGQARGFLGDLAAMEGRVSEADRCYRDELAIAMEIGRADEIARANMRLAKLAGLRGQSASTQRRYLERAHIVYYQLADEASCAQIERSLEQLDNGLQARRPGKGTGT